MAKKGKKKSKRSENLIALSCSSCGRRNYYTTKNKKKLEGKLSLKKYCRWCKKHLSHTETKISARAKKKDSKKGK
ncbi:50S ribosomal protein L33 [Candidatus Parcubacteria bacterium]|nr:MAG: 50S ribosomal protein L33 [Candidatus Parcubacteria bacterium]